uniref:UBR-type domain-containing protein n=1 Tax=Meloidogyne incognita TaxID=6306 RepID=A0A914MGN4_MELIC
MDKEFVRKFLCGQILYSLDFFPFRIFLYFLIEPMCFSYSSLELIGITDVLISPIRLGIVKPSVSIVSNEDVLEVLQHLTNEQDLSSLIWISMQGGYCNESSGGLANNERIIQLADLRRGDSSEEQEENALLCLSELSGAEAVKISFEQKWQEMINSAPTAKAHQQQQLLNELTSEISKKDSSPETGKDEPESADASDLINKRIPMAAEERQDNSIEIIRELCKNSVVREYFIDLMRQRDINGHSPFETALYQRAYSAALLVWQTAIDVKDWSQDVVDILMPSVGSDDTNDDSSLFILCANDTCSYTWTGEEHTPQKIYECKTCGLVGTLCCCTECALLWHRNLDCKLKKTSPTDYCDCWEKCECKASVTENNAKREQLPSGMLQYPVLIDGLNSKGEHILRFLTRTVCRQLIEQEGYTKRSKRPGPTTTTTTYGVPIPEHDLESADRQILALPIKQQLLLKEKESKFRLIGGAPMIGTKIANKKLWWKRPIAVKRAAKTQNNEATTSTQKNIDTDNADINVGNDMNLLKQIVPDYLNCFSVLFTSSCIFSGSKEYETTLYSYLIFIS